MILCPLCESAKTNEFFADPRSQARYYNCHECDLRFLHPEALLSPQDERERYNLHQNDVHDLNYQAFVRPLAEQIIERVKIGSKGLDFGCGPGPVMAYILSRAGYAMTTYDPFFDPNPSAFTEIYDFVVATEVIEHFYHPRNEFVRLKKLVRSSGVIGLMTALYHPDIDFPNWYYRRDPTHVSFYSQKTFAWLGESLEFSDVEILGDRCILLTRS